MYRLEPTPAEIERRADLLERVRGHAHVALRYPRDLGRGWLAQALAQVPEARLFRISPEPDRVERLVLEIADLFGAEIVAAVADRLQNAGDDLSATLAILTSRVGDIRLAVDAWNSLAPAYDTYDVGHAQDARTATLREWLAEHAWIIADTAFRPPVGSVLVRFGLPTEAPSRLVNGTTIAVDDLWSEFAPDVSSYEAALALIALEGGRQVSIVPSRTLRASVVELLPDPTRRFLALAGMHGRWLSSAVCSALGSPDLSLGAALGFWHRLGDGYVVEPSWAAWCRGELSEVSVTVHRQLANTFASAVRVSDPSATGGALAVLEAHRHYVRAGEYEQGRRFARYSLAVLVETAKRLSTTEKYDEAAHLYQMALDLTESTTVTVGRRVRACIRHYIHFNRGRADAEPIAETERGYEQALAEWPENALFWSRLIRTRVYRNDLCGALSCFEQALRDDVVAPHPEKQSVLIVRTVRGLLEHDRLIEAALFWGSYEPTAPFGVEVGHVLMTRLAAGWRVTALAVPGHTPVIFSTEQIVKTQLIAPRAWLAELPQLRVRARGTSAAEALGNLVEQLRTQTAALIRAQSHTLDSSSLMAKRMLVGAVNVIASRLDAIGPEQVWVLGDLERDADRLWLRSGGAFDVRFAIPEDLARSLVVADVPYFGLVKAAGSGVPVGPVTRLEPAYGSEHEVLSAWERRTRDAG